MCLFCGLGIMVMLAFLKDSGKWWSRSEVLKSFVICVNPFLGICLSVFTFMLSGVSVH